MVDAPTLRAFWSARQGMDGSLSGSTPREVIERVGWARSVGGTTPYLTAFSRAGIRRPEMDAAVAALEIHELPSARDCTYVVPAGDFALAATVGGGASSTAELRAAEKLGVARAEVDGLAEDVLSALADGDADPAGIRKTLGDKVRSLGDAGKRKGITTTLPLALGLLQAQSRIRRVPVDGRLDNQRFRYTPWPDAPRWEGSAAQARAALARRYWDWIGVASIPQFRWFSGFGAADAKAAIAELALQPVGDDGLLASADTAADLAGFAAPAAPRVALIGWLDSLVLLRRDLPGVLEAADRDHPLLEPSRSAGGSLTDLPHQGIVDRGRLIGLWDFDADAGEVVWAAVSDLDADQRDAVDEAVAATAAYVATDLGDNRGMSLDSPKSRQPRLEALRRYAP